jgi:hypothetical protein
MTLLDVQSESAPRELARRSRGMERWVCTSNPFYVLSALFGLPGIVRLIWLARRDRPNLGTIVRIRPVLVYRS